jgi:hypothetical protein
MTGATLLAKVRDSSRNFKGFINLFSGVATSYHIYDKAAGSASAVTSIDKTNKKVVLASGKKITFADISRGDKFWVVDTTAVTDVGWPRASSSGDYKTAITTHAKFNSSERTNRINFLGSDSKTFSG